MVVIDAVGTHGCCASGGIDLGEVTVLVEFQDVLLNALIGRVGTEIDIVAVCHSHTLILSRATGPYRSELARLTVVGDDIGTLVNIVAIDVAIDKGVDHGPERVHRHARSSRDLRAIHVDQCVGDVAGSGDIDLVAESGQSPCVAVFAIAARGESVGLSLAPVGVGNLRNGVAVVVPHFLCRSHQWQKGQSEK